MPKVDINAALRNDEKESSNRKNMARKATGALLGGNAGFGINDFAEDSTLRVQAIPYEKLKERDINEFSDAGDINFLAESIRMCGLINPLSVVFHRDEDIYVISAGHRRYKAIGILHDQYPNEKRYQSVDCAVYEVTDDEFELKQGLPYITKEQEEAIYKDSNLESRQLSYEDIAKQIRYIVKKFDNPEYMKVIRDDLEKEGVRTYTKSTDKVKLIVNVLSTQNYSGWSRETIRQYLQIMETERTDLLDQIENGTLKVHTAYKICTEEENKLRTRRTTKIKRLRQAAQDFFKEAESRVYSEEEITELREYIVKLTEIVETNSQK